MLEWEKSLNKDNSVKKVSLELNTAKINHINLLIGKIKRHIDNLEVDLTHRDYRRMIKNNNEVSETIKDINKIIKMLTSKSK